MYRRLILPLLLALTACADAGDTAADGSTSTGSLVILTAPASLEGVRVDGEVVSVTACAGRYEDGVRCAPVPFFVDPTTQVCYAEASGWLRIAVLQ